jgi:hypothetical protein
MYLKGLTGLGFFKQHLGDSYLLFFHFKKYFYFLSCLLYKKVKLTVIKGSTQSYGQPSPLGGISHTLQYMGMSTDGGERGPAQDILRSILTEK